MLLGGSCRTGKIMKYDPETGHRIKDENCPGRINWVHSLMKASGQLPREWELTQCLFGEHLLRQYPGKLVAMVESEKTAVICTGLMPRLLWLVTGGKSMINERLWVLKGRRVVAFPDIGSQTPTKTDSLCGRQTASGNWAGTAQRNERGRTVERVTTFHAHRHQPSNRGRTQRR